MSLSREWFTAAEITSFALPGLPGTDRGLNKMVAREGWSVPARAWHPVNNPAGIWRRRTGVQGGPAEYHYSVLPSRAQAKLATMFPAADAAASLTKKAKREALDRDQAWHAFEALPESKRDRARALLQILDEVETLVRGGTAKEVAVELATSRHKITPAAYWKWRGRVNGIAREDWLPYLVDRRMGRTVTVSCDDDAWDFLRADYLRADAPTYQDCYRRLERAAKKEGWTIPSARTLERRIEEIALPVRVLARQGLEALKRLYPAQERDRSRFHAMEAVNADGHKWDVFVQWPDGEIVRPMMVAIQDLYSGMILSWRFDKSANKDAVRLAIGDMVEQWGVPTYIWLDNGRDFASKWITGGTPNRYRFKVREEEPSGILTQLGVEVHWTTPYSGQSKPIERAFRDFCNGIAKDPRLSGAYTGNTVLNKPESYGSRAVPLDEFLAVVAEGIVEHNTRAKRRSQVCQGIHSFQDVFTASYASAPVRKATEEQRRLWLLAAEAVKASKTDGTLELEGNRYWAEFLHGYLGSPLVIRFDPQDLHGGIHVYETTGRYLGFAECLHAVGFADTAAAREHSRNRKGWMRASKEALEREKRMTLSEVAALMPSLTPAPAPESKIVRPLFAGNAAIAARPAEEAMDDAAFGAALQAGVRGLRLVHTK